MRSDLTDITLVVDRSGSMQARQSDAQGGVNQFIEDQKKAAGQALLTLVQFDHEYEFVHKGVDVKQVVAYALVPRGNTALLDAVGRAINETGERLAAMAEADRPKTVVFVVVTDGQENASREFTLAKVKEMIERQQKEYNWQFVFLGSDPSTFAAGCSMGIAPDKVAQFAEEKTSGAYATASAKIGTLRAMNVANPSLSVKDADAVMAYSPAEREELGKP